MTNTIKNFGIDEATMLLEFNASVWTARKLDKSATDEVVTTKGAKSKDAARVNKSLMAGRTELTEIQAVVGEARTFVYENTAPWSDVGQRWITTNRLLKVDKRMQDFSVVFWEKVDAFCNIYPTLITAQAMALGDMFNRNDYPPVAEIRRKFAFNYDFLPVPTADFRVRIPNDAAEDLRARLETANTRRMEAALGDIRAKMKAHLERMADRLITVTNKKGEPSQQRFHDTLVTSAYDLCDLIGDFNVTGDPDMASMKQRLEKVLAGASAEDLRVNGDKREEVRKEVDAMLSAFNW